MASQNQIGQCMRDVAVDLLERRRRVNGYTRSAELGVLLGLLLGGPLGRPLDLEIGHCNSRPESDAIRAPTATDPLRFSLEAPGCLDAVLEVTLDTVLANLCGIGRFRSPWRRAEGQ